MRDQHHRAVELLQRFGQRLAHVEVEVVGRLVEQQQVGALQHDQREHEARLLAAGKRAHRLRRACSPGKSNLPRKSRGPARRARVAGAAGAATGVASRSQLFELVLREIADRAGRALRLRSPASGGDRRRRCVLISVDLPAPFGAEQADALAGRAATVRRASSTGGARRSRQRDVLEARAAGRGRRAGLRELELERAVDGTGAISVHAFQRLDAALRLPRLGRLGPETVDEALQVRALALLLS